MNILLKEKHFEKNKHFGKKRIFIKKPFHRIENAYKKNYNKINIL